ncbi:MAG: ATP-binding protein [Gaiellales bacterium]
MPRLSLRARLALAFAAGMAAVSIAVAGFVYIQLRNDLVEGVDMGLQSRAQVIVDAAARRPAIGGGAIHLIDSDEAFAQVLAADGSVLESTPAVAGSPLVASPLLRAAGRPTFFDVTPRGLDSSRLLVVPATLAEKHAYVVVGATLSNSQEALHRVFVLFAIALPAALLVSSLIGWLLAGAALRPVGRMSREAEAIGSSDPARRLQVPDSDPSLAALATTLNATFDRLQDMLARERGFVDNASHELRTPLTILKAEVDSALSTPRSHDELEAALRSAGSEIRHLISIAEGLLVLARANRGRIPVHRVDTPLTEVVEASVNAFRARADALDVRLHASVQPVTVSVDRTRVRQALDNLLDNALSHTPPGGWVCVLGTADGDTFEIAVEDSGPGFDDLTLGHAFHPFSPRTATQAGTGLGLAIAHAIATAHGGSASAENLPQGGARVAIVLPIGHPPARDDPARRAQALPTLSR